MLPCSLNQFTTHLNLLAITDINTKSPSADSYLPRKFRELGPVSADDPLAEVVVVDGRADPALGLLTRPTVITSTSP